MTRKDYEAIATAFAEVWAMIDDPNDCLDGSGRQTWGSLRGRVADTLAANNPRFDRERFVAACGFVEATA